MLIISPDVASSLVVVDDTASNITAYPVWTTVTSGNAPAFVSSTKMAVNPSTGNFKAESFSVSDYGVGLSRSYFGYSSTYKTVQLGTLGGSSAISLGVDLTANASGSFQGNEIVIPNAKAMIAPNAANNGYVGVLRINASNILELGSADYSFATPYMKLANGAVSSPSILTLTGNLSLSAAASTDAMYAHNNTYGAVVYGYGSTYDAALLDRNTNPIIGVAAGSATVNGNLSVVNTSSTITVRSSTTTGTTLGNKGNRLLLASDSGTVGNGGEVVFAANDLDVDRWAAISGHIIANGAGGCVGDIVFATKTNTTDATLTERMRIDSAGAVTAAVSLRVESGVEATLITAYTGSNYGAIYNGNVTPSNTNYVLAHNATTSYLNATSNVYLNVNGVTIGAASGTGFSVIGTLGATGAVTGSNLSGTNTGDNAANSSTHYVGTTAIALNRSSAAQALTGITSIDGSAATLTTARTINGTSFNGSANILTTEWYHSGRDFPTGTLITTSIDYSVTNGDPWVLEIKGNSYGQLIPFDIQVQGYIYSDTIINYGGYSNGSGLTTFSVFNNGGFLCFWFNNAVYWQGFNVRAYTAYGTYALNKVTSIANSAKPGGITKEVSISLVQSLHSSNFSTYAATAGHTHTGVYEPANANIQSHISNTSNPHAVTWAQLGSKPTTVSGFGITDFYSTNSTGATAPDSATINGHYYSTGLSQLGQTDGGLYVQAYSSSWVGQIYQDYRTGQISLRSKNSGTWTHASNAEWRKVHDTYNLAALGGWTPVVSGVSITGNTFTKTSGASPGWDAQVYSSEGYVTDVMVQFSPVQTDKHIMVGLNSDPTTNADYATLDYSFYLVGSSNVLHIYESGSDAWTGGTFAATDVLTITYNGEYIKYYHNNTLVRTVARALSTTKLYLDSSFYELGSSVANLKFGTTKGDTLYNNAQKYAGHLYSGATDPTNTDRLNYDGYLYATRFYGDGSQLTNLPSPSASPSDIYAFAAAYG